MQTIRLTLLAASLAAALTGCSTPGYRCPLSDTGADCASMSEAYSAALHAQLGEDDGSMTVAHKEPVSVFSHAKRPTQTAVPVSFEGYPQAEAHGGPVYEQAQVHRAWTAPWTDAAGVLHGGEYVYFATPGHWRYGETMAAGQASAIFAPVKPTAFGVAAAAADLAATGKHVDLARDKITPLPLRGSPGAKALGATGGGL